jgi:hypothetical protein
LGFIAFHGQQRLPNEYRCAESSLNQSLTVTKPEEKQHQLAPFVSAMAPYSPPNTSFAMLSISVFYVDFSRPVELENLNHFCLFGVHVNHARVDYQIILTAPEHILNSATNQSRILDLAVPPFVRSAGNVDIRWRPNEGSDFCTLTNMMKDPNFSSIVNRKTKDGSAAYYTHFWLMNGTVRGPFLPIWAWRVGIPWWDSFLAVMEAGANGDLVDMVSSHASCENGHLHCQSMALLLTRRAFDIAVETFYCQRPDQLRYLWIHDTEVVRLIFCTILFFFLASLIDIWYFVCGRIRNFQRTLWLKD